MTRTRLALSVLVVLAPNAAMGLPAAAVAVAVAPQQAQATVVTAQTVLVDELAKHGIKVTRSPVPPRVSAKPGRLAAYARAHRLQRVFELRLLPKGRKLMVVLAEKRRPGMRPTFAARLSATQQEVERVIPQLVAAVVNRTAPKPLPASQPVATEKLVASAAPPAEQVAAAPTAEARPESQAAPASSRGHLVWGFSIQPGMFLRAPAAMFGGSGKLYYQRGAYRVGLEVGGMGGQGTVFDLAARGHYLFQVWPKIAPLVGAGLGYLMVNNADGEKGSGASFSASVGAQFTQFHWARLVGEIEVLLPMFSAQTQDPEYRNGNIQILEHSSWSPALAVKLSCLF